jgi:hypothetical protein
MTKFVVIFLPDTCRSRCVGEVVSLLESLYLNVSESMKFHMEPEALEKLDEYERIISYWKENYCVDQVNKNITTLKEFAKEGNLFAIKFDSPIIHSKDKLQLCLYKKAEIRPCCWMILTEDQIQ